MIYILSFIIDVFYVIYPNSSPPSATYMRQWSGSSPLRTNEDLLFIGPLGTNCNSNQNAIFFIQLGRL